MTEATLRTKLQDFLSPGWLQLYHTREQFSIYCLLKTVYVGFFHSSLDSEEEVNNPVRGFLLTRYDADLIVRASSSDALQFVAQHQESHFIFTEEVLSLCQTPFGRMRLKKQIRCKGYLDAYTDQSNPDLPEVLPSCIDFSFLSTLSDARQEHNRAYQRFRKITKRMGLIAIGCIFLAMVLLGTNNLRRQWNPDRTAEAFDRQAGTAEYACVEADLLASFGTLNYALDAANPDPQFSHNVCNYYLYGNSQTEAYGLLCFESLGEEMDLFPEGTNCVTFKEPILMYGRPDEIPAVAHETAEALWTDTMTDAPAEESDLPLSEWESITLPDGTEVHIPVHIPSVPNYSTSYGPVIDNQNEDVFRFLAEQGIDFRSDCDLGTAYLRASLNVETTVAPINRFLNFMMDIFFSVGVTLLLPIIIFAGKADSSLSVVQAINKGEALQQKLNKFLAEHKEENAGSNTFCCQICGKELPATDRYTGNICSHCAEHIINLANTEDSAEVYLDDNTFIQNIHHLNTPVWHQYDVLLDARNYGWEDMKDWADYMADEDLENISEVTVGIIGLSETNIEESYRLHGRSLRQIPELQEEHGTLSIAGVSKTLAVPVKIIWFNQTRSLRFFTLIDDTLLMKKYAETVVRRSFNTENAMKLGKPLPAPREPVTFSGQTVAICSDAFALWRSKNRFQQQFECTGVIPLTQKEPVITLVDDDIQTRQFVLQTEGDEDFTGKYFHISVRLGISSHSQAPIAQIDGFISDTPEVRAFSVKDIGYRMEGYFLRSSNKAALYYETLRGQDLPAKALRYPGYTTPSNVRLMGICPDCGKSFCFHGYAFYMIQEDVAYSDDGLDCCAISDPTIDKHTWVYEADGKNFRYYNSFCCPHCGTPYIDYRKYPENKAFGVSGCVHLGRKYYQANEPVQNH